MGFVIEFIDEPVPNPQETGPAAVGLITIGGYEERFVASLESWGRLDYERSWRNALEVIARGGEKSALISSIRDASAPGIVRWWPIYRVTRREVAIQEHLLVLSETGQQFDVRDPYRLVPPYSTVGEDGERVSEWRTAVDDLRSFLTRIAAVDPGM